MTDRSIAFAERIQRDLAQQGQDANKRRWIGRAIRLAYGRNATKKEQESLHAYLEEMLIYHADHPPERIEYPKQVVRSLVEEFTGEPFEFVEKLNAYDDYEPGPKPWTATVETRALADVCLLLLNSNEFVLRLLIFVFDRT